MTRTHCLAVATLFLCAVLTLSADAASHYSLRGYGEAVIANGAEARGQGGASAAGSVPHIGSNPATLALATRARFSGTYETQWLRTEEARESGETGIYEDYEGLVPDLSVVFPLPGKLCIGGGFSVDRRQGGSIQRAIETPDGQPYTQRFELSGNLLRMPVLAAWDAGRVQLGAGLDVIVLNRKVRWENEFPDDSDFTSSANLDRSSLWGISWRGGMRLPLHEKLTLGSWASSPGKVDGLRTLSIDDPSSSSPDLEEDRDAETAWRWGVGLESALITRLRLRADYTREAWEDADPLSPSDRLVDVHRLAVGIEWASGSAQGIQWPIRLGYRTENLSILDASGDENREHVLTLGSGFSFSEGRGTFDTYAEYGWRGERDISEFQERFVRVGITLTGLEKWSRRRNPEEEDDDW